MKLEDVILRDTRALQPTAGSVPSGTLYYVTDENKTERSNGTAWESYSDVTSVTTAPLHATTHSLGGTDPVTITNLAGYPGGTTNFLRADGTFAAPTSAVVRRQVTLIIDNGTSVITTGYKTWISMPMAGTWKKWRILADVSGSIVIDVWKDVYANYPPTVADTITAAAKPTLSSALSAESSTLTGWTTSFSAGDVLGFNVDSVTTVKKISLTLEFE